MAQMKYGLFSGLEPIAEGIHLVEIIESRREPMKDKSGDTLKIDLLFLEGEFRGRKLWDWIDIWSSNPSKHRKARKKLNQILRAVGIDCIENSTELHRRPMKIRVINLVDRRDEGIPFAYVEEYLMAHNR